MTDTIAAPTRFVTCDVDPETGAGELRIEGVLSRLPADGFQASYNQIVVRAQELAKECREPVQVEAKSPNFPTTWLVIHPNGHIEKSVTRPTAAAADAAVGRVMDAEGVAVARTPLSRQESEIARVFPQPPEQRRVPVPKPSAAPAPVRPVLARQGIRGWLNSLGFRLRPGVAEQAELDDIAALSRSVWRDPRTISVVNPKGGSGKTPAAILLAAAFGRFGAPGVLAWDLSPQGTLGTRTESSELHDASLETLIAHMSGLLRPGFRAANLADFVHYQPEDRFDVLRAARTPLNGRETVRLFETVHELLQRFYRLTIIDSHDDRGWSGATIDHVDHLVVPTTTRPQDAYDAHAFLQSLYQRGYGARALAKDSTVLLSQVDARDPGATDELVARFQFVARTVVVVPYDPAMSDSRLNFEALKRPTRRAYTRAAASIARLFHDASN